MSPARSSIPETGTPGAAGARKTAGTGRRKTLRKSPGKAPAAGRKTGTKATKSSTSARLQPGPLLRARARKIVSGLKRAYPGAHCALHFRSPLELYVATVLSAQCTDERVNQVTRDLFRRYRSARDYAEAPQEEMEEAVRTTGFYRNKAKAVRGCCRQLVERFDGKVPDEVDALVTLPGVGRKTANIVLGNAFGKPAIGVDTHVKRLAGRMGFSRRTDPDQIEADLCRIVPQASWVRFCHLLQFHGRQVCLARKPRCPSCPVNEICPKIGL
jgi:endonuclease-3